MKKPEDQINIVNESADTLAEQLGLSIDRRKEIQKTVDGFISEEMEKDNGSPANVIVRVWNEFENPYECAYCLYILHHEENRVQINSLFGLPQSVEA